jgi:hypothetical protein
MTIPRQLDHTQRAALALFHAARANAETSAAAIAAASGLSIEPVRWSGVLTADRSHGAARAEGSWRRRRP